MSDIRLFGSTSNLVRFCIKDKTTGQGKTGLTTATAGLIISTIADNEATATVYTQAGSTIETITTLGTFATPTATKCRFKQVDATNHPGLYEFQFADTRFAIANSKRLIISVNDAEATILDTDYEIELVQFNPFDAVRLGLTALPNVVSGSAGALPTTGTGANQIHVDGSGNVFALDSLGNTLATATAVANIGVTTAALNQTAASATYTVGVDTGGVANTYTLDGVYDSVADSAGTVDFYYEFTLAASGQTAVGVNWVGYVVGVVNTIKVYAYNWGGASWDQIGSIIGIAGVVNQTQDWELTSAHTGTGGNAGKVRIRYNNTGLTASSTKTDRILLGYVNVITVPTNFSSMAISGAGGVTLADGVAHGGTPGSSTATLAMQKVHLANPTGFPLYVTTSAVGYAAMYLESTVGGPALSISSFGGAGNGDAVVLYGDRYGVDIAADCPLHVIFGQGSGTHTGVLNAIHIEATSASEDAVYVKSFTAGKHDINLAGSGDINGTIPTTGNAANSINDCLNAARAQGFGKWVIDTGAKTLKLYASDGTTVVRTFTLDSVTAPASRT